MQVAMRASSISLAPTHKCYCRSTKRGGRMAVMGSGRVTLHHFAAYAPLRCMASVEREIPSEQSWHGCRMRVGITAPADRRYSRSRRSSASASSFLRWHRMTLHLIQRVGTQRRAMGQLQRQGGILLWLPYIGRLVTALLRSEDSLDMRNWTWARCFLSS